LRHPSISHLYRDKVTGLCRVLEGDEASRAGARERILGLMDEISLQPQEDRLGIVLKGNLAGTLRLAQDNKSPSEPTTSWPSAGPRRETRDGEAVNAGSLGAASHRHRLGGKDYSA
jgi:hypothetical protein